MKAKTIYLSLFLVGVAFFLTSSMVCAQKTETLTAVFRRVLVDCQFEFVDGKGKSFFFSELGEDVKFDLIRDEDDLHGAMFKITWIEDSKEIYDDKGKPTGTFKKFKKILKLRM